MSTAKKEPLLPPLWVIVVFLCVVLCWVLYELKEMVALLVVGYCIAYLMVPALKYLERKNISRSIGVLLIMFLVVVFVLLLALTAVPTVLNEYGELSTNLPNYLEIARQKFSEILSKISGLINFGVANTGAGAEDFNLSSLTSSISGDTFNNIFRAIASTLLKGYSITLTLINAALLPFIVFYIAVDFERIHEGFLKLFPVKQRKSITEMAKEINVCVSAFVRGQMLVAVILFFLFAAGLGIIGVELWFLLAVIAGLGNMVPYLGTIVGITLSSIMALVSFGDFYHLLAVWILFAIVQFLEGTFITPKVVGEKVGLSPLAVILALFAGGSLFGLIGIMLAVPGAAAFRVLGRNLLEWISSRSEGV
ncbi:MAG: AI-2E family transporter [Bdellovibrionales bacterium]|nr:AI-2E family transporter [Bdellovibrionales bacterium]